MGKKGRGGGKNGREPREIKKVSSAKNKHPVAQMKKKWVTEKRKGGMG